MINFIEETTYTCILYTYILCTKRIVYNKVKTINFLFLSGWFGIRKDFSHFLLSICPILQEYANIAYSSGRTTENGERNENVQQLTHYTKDKMHKKCDNTKPVIPVISIEMPD